MNVMNQGFQLVLGSKSPRRKELLAGMGFLFEIRTKETEENYPSDLNPIDVPVYLAEIKADALLQTLSDSEILITSDTIVLLEGEILGKPTDANHAIEMLKKLSGKTHDVVTGVCLLSPQKKHAFSVTTKVHFKPLTLDLITHYVTHYKPFDKAGSYGIQEWIGYVGIDKIEGSYFNVVGLPTAELWEALKNF